MAAYTLLLVVALLSLFACLSFALDGIIIPNLDRRIVLDSHVAFTYLTFKVENTGVKPVSTVLLALTKQQAEHLAFIQAVQETKKSKFDPPALEISPVASYNGAPANVTFYALKLTKELKPGKTSPSITCSMGFLDLVHPFPPEIAQSDVQLVVFHDSHLALSPYKVVSESTTLQLPTTRIESFTPMPPHKHSGTSLKFGPYENVLPFSWSELRVHFQLNKAFPVMARAEREIEISHWGNVYVTEDYHLVHTGAKHVGQFSRLDFERRQMDVGPALRGLVGILPKDAHSVIYRDSIGNISTSNLMYHKDRTEIAIIPRYPLLGGWSFTFRLAYSLPLTSVATIAKDGTRVLRVPIGGPFYEAPTRDLTVKVVLPEGAYRITPSYPVPLEASHETKYSYLDTVGRPVLVLKKKNLVAQTGAQLFEVSYKFSTASLLREPFILILTFFLFFLVAIVYARSDLTIATNTPAYLAKKQGEEASYLASKLLKLLAQRDAAVNRMEASLVALGRTRNVAAAKAAKESAQSALQAAGGRLKEAMEGREKKLAGNAEARKVVDELLSLDTQRGVFIIAKYNAAVEAYEANLSTKEIAAKVSTFQEKLAAVNEELVSLRSTLKGFV